MKATIERACGHLTEEQLYGSGQERDRRAAWLREQPCLQCQRAAETAAAQAQAETRRLPTLTGSEKQVGWAERIRAEKLAALDADLARANEGSKRAVAAGQVSQHAVDQQAAYFVSLVDEIARQPEARWWIDRRGYIATQLLKEAAGR